MQLKKQTRLKRNANACTIKCTLVPTYAFNVQMRFERARTRYERERVSGITQLTTLELLHACALKEAHFFNVWIFSVDLLVCLVFSIV